MDKEELIFAYQYVSTLNEWKHNIENKIRTLNRGCAVYQLLYFTQMLLISVPTGVSTVLTLLASGLVLTVDPNVILALTITAASMNVITIIGTVIGVAFSPQNTSNSAGYAAKLYTALCKELYTEIKNYEPLFKHITERDAQEIHSIDIDRVNRRISSTSIPDIDTFEIHGIDNRSKATYQNSNQKNDINSRLMDFEIFNSKLNTFINKEALIAIQEPRLSLVGYFRPESAFLIKSDKNYLDPEDFIHLNDIRKTINNLRNHPEELNIQELDRNFIMLNNILNKFSDLIGVTDKPFGDIAIV